jgi:hypothetical protein
VDPDDLTGNDDDTVAKPAQGGDKREIAPEATSPKTQDDTQLKKALDLLKDKR